MQRLFISFLSLALLAPALHAQPAPDAPPATSPPAEPTAPTPATPPGAAPSAEESARAAESPSSKPTEDMPRKIAVAKDSPGAFFTPGLLLQGQFVYDGLIKAGAAGASDVSFSTTRFKLRRLEISASG